MAEKILKLYFCKNKIASLVLARAISVVNTQPTLDRTILGLYKSDLGLAIITASIFAASAVRNKAPILPGFSGASATRISGFLAFNFKVSSLVYGLHYFRWPLHYPFCF
jgi:hypothetical protein